MAFIFTLADEKYFLSLVRSALRGEKPENAPQGVSFSNIFALARLHSLCELVAYAIPALTVAPPSEIAEGFHRVRMSGIAQQIHQDVEMKAILKSFTDAGIDLLPLKGAVMKRLYPSPDMRSMCDIDILIRPEQFESAKAIMLEKLGYKAENTVEDEHDLGFSKPPFINIELHHSVTDKDGNKEAYEYYKNVWSLARLKDGEKHLYEFSREDFYIHHVEHLTKHYRYGGCGVRAFCDVYVFLSKYGNELDFEYINGVFEKMKLDKFAEHVKNAALKWFGDGEGDEVTELIERYVLHGGAYGLSEDKETSTIARKHTSGKRINRLGFLWRKIFLPYKSMKNGYPVLRKAPFLLPFCWLHRIFDRLLFKRDRVKKQLTVSSSDEDVSSYISHIESVGLEL